MSKVGLLVLIIVLKIQSKEVKIEAQNQLIFYNGRWLSQDGCKISDWPGTSFMINMIGSNSLSITFGKQPFLEYQCSSLYGVRFMLNVWVNGHFIKRIQVTNKIEGDQISLIDGLNENIPHQIKITKSSEQYCGFGERATCGAWSIQNIILNGYDPYISTVTRLSHKKILFIGDSLTAAYGVDQLSPCDFDFRTQNIDHSHSNILADLFQVDNYQVIAWSGKGLVRNYGDPNDVISKENMIELFNRTLALSSNDKYNLQNFIPDHIFINLGSNDYSGGVYHPKIQDFKLGIFNLTMNILNQNYPKAQIYYSCIYFACDIIKDEIDQINNKQLHFFNLQNIVDNDLINGCNSHPSIVGQQKIAKEMYQQFIQLHGIDQQN